MDEKKLFLLDAYALIYRAYYALMRSPRLNAKGFNTSAVFGFVNTLEEVLRKENPGYIAVCFDPAGGKTFRHEEYAEYKAGRDKQPEDITLAIPYIKRILAAYRIPVVEMERYEADDIIGTLATHAAKEGFTTYMMTPDKDYGQLVADNILMYRPSLKGQGFEIRGPQQVCERYGITSPRQVIDLLALEGDASDNVPGCPGVGEKTAVKLIAQFGSVEEMLAHTDQIKGALRAKVEANAESIRHSKWLVTICTDVPVGVRPADLVRREPDIDALVEVFGELDFKSLIGRYTTAANSSPVPPPAAVTATSLFDLADAEEAAMLNMVPETEIIDSAEAASQFIGRAIAAGDVGVSLADFNADAMTGRPAGIALAYLGADNRSAYLPWSLAGLPQLLEPLFADAKVRIVGADIKRLMLFLAQINVEFSGAAYFDTSVAHYLCNPEGKHDIASLAMTYLGAVVYGYDAAGKNRHSAVSDRDAIAAQAAQTAETALRLMPLLRKEVDEKGQTKLLDDIELPLVAVLASMEHEGARIDVGELHRLSQTLAKRLDALEGEAARMAGRPFNASSPSQVGQILFGEMQIDPKARRTKSGSWSTAEDVLEKYAAEVPLVRTILDIRGLRKLLATYVDALPKMVNPITGKIHTTYNQTVTSTGRISSTNPNLQNIPIRTADGRDIRRAFVADKGDLLLSADYSQIELRLMADLSGDPAMTEAFLSGADIHRATAAKIYHLTLDEVTDDQRRNAKTANFGIIYGISAFGLSERLGIPRAEAKELIEGYLATYPKVKEYMEQAIENARRDGFVSTITGRRRYLPDINSRSAAVRAYAERNAINAPLQGSAADIIKLAMVRIHRDILSRGLKSRMIMQVHDELIFNVKPDEAAELEELVVEGMKGAYRGRVPMEVAAGIATNWLDAH